MAERAREWEVWAKCADRKTKPAEHCILNSKHSLSSVWINEGRKAIWMQRFAAIFFLFLKFQTKGIEGDYKRRQSRSLAHE